MAGRARSKIQKLLNELDSAAPGIDVPVGLGLQDLVHGVDQFGLSDALSRPETRGAADPGAADDLLDFLPLSSRGGWRGGAADDSQTASTLSPTSSSLGSTPIILATTSRGAQGKHYKDAQTQALQERLAYAERRVQQLLAENRALQLGHAEVQAAKHVETEGLRAQLTGTLRDMQLRQQELEAAAPLLRLRIEDFRAQLEDLRVSDSAAKDLKLLQPSQRTALDEIKLAVHEALSEGRAEAERLRTALATAREAAARSEEAGSKAKLDASRANAALAERERDLALVTEGLQARIERLASELESSLVAAQLGQAKAAMYDELRAKLDAATTETQRLQVVEATYRRLDQQAAEDRATAAQREHGYEMLQMDKAYLTSQVDLLADQLRKAEAELQLRDKKINELSRHKTELFEKLMASESLKGREEEARLQKELAALQQRTHADLEKIRVDTAEAYEREARLLRELRDTAQDDASRTKAALAELQGFHEKYSLAHAEVVKRMEQQITALQSELKQRSFELSHFKVVVAEKEQLAGRANMQIELLQDKLTVLMDKYRSLEVEHNSTVNKALQAAAEVVASGGVHAQQQQQPGGGASSSGVELLLLKQERDGLAREAASLQERLRSAQDSVRLASQPHSFLLSELEEIRTRAATAEAKLAAAQAALSTRSAEVEALTAERDGLKSDLDGLLSQRMQLEGMKAVVVKALAGGLPHMQMAAAMAAAGPGGPAGGRRLPMGYGQTMIVGEGRQEQ